MIRYRLDDLGWFQFEWLIQALLKAKLGFSIESWGGTSDTGRDAYCSSALPLIGDQILEGPFLFQVKFIQEANAAGSRPQKAVIDAISAEVRKRRSQGNALIPPRHYVFLTNARLTVRIRKQGEEKFLSAFPDSIIHLMGGNDICDLLDGHPSVRQSFPQLMGLRDLKDLLASVVNKEVLERSSAAIQSASGHTPVFVPTAAYNRSLQTLNKYSIAVLDGPPEMGKSAIAWVIALTQLATGWQALICDKPADFFQLFDADVSQVFVADDAFGRTEYDPSRGKEWEQQLDRVLRKLDRQHWLIWTSRRHILQRALSAMDLQGLAIHFPQAREIIVNAENLTPNERALILYRHAKAANLSVPAKNLLRAHAKEIVKESSFTPERIRRLVKEIIPDLAERLSGMQGSTGRLAENAIREAIRKPTGRMEKTFRSLPDEYKRVLISIVDAGDHATSEEVRSSVNQRMTSPISDRRFEEIVEELSESFLKITKVNYPWQRS